MFSVCKVTHQPTAVEHVISCHFFNQSVKSLVVAGANIIRVFQLIPDVDLNAKNYHYTDNNPPKMKLECLAQFSLFGNLMSMQAVSLANLSRDALILSFRDAKFSIVEYDPDTHDLRTLSLHYFEEDEMKDGWSSSYDIPIVRVDPEHRCAAMLAHGRRLVILPFRVDTLLEESDTTFLEADEENSQVLPSYTIVLKSIDEKIENVIDIQFLHGYYEPTILILYEPVRTFSGRLAVRKDTCAMITISLNIQQQVHPVIWSLTNLPYDCVRALAVCKPIGGVLIFAVNSLLYLNQSVPPYGVSLNSLAESTTNFPLKQQEGVKLTLDCAQTSFISHDKLVISVKTGELYVLSLQADSMRSVRSFHFEKSAASVLTTCMCVFEDNYLFLGSRLGNSLLLRFSTKEQVTMTPAAEEKAMLNEQPSKKKKLNTLGDWMASNVSEIRDEDELEMYGNERQSSVIKITSFVFEVCDSLLNIGPCGHVSMGEPAFLSEEFSNNADPDVELVTTSGYGKNGALCILQRSIRPQVVTTFELPNYIDMWTVIGTNSTEEQHAFMILSQEDSTMILQTGREITELDQSGFSTQGPTIFAGNLGHNKYILQVTQMGVRLLQGSEQVQHIPLDLGSPLIHASAADPHVVILTEDGQLILLTLREVRPTVSRLTVQRPTNFSLKPHITTICVHRDISGLFSHSIPEAEKRFHGIKKEKNLISALKGDIEDEDELLYGDAGPQTDVISQTAYDFLNSQFKASSSWWKKYMHPIKPTYWLFLTRDNGHFEIYSIPDFTLSYLVSGIGMGLSVLADSLNAAPVVAQPSQQAPTTNTSGTETEVKEILAVSLGHNGRRPLLLVRLQDEIFIYQAYRYPKGFLKVRFKKVASLLTRCKRTKSKNKEGELMSSDACQLRFFNNIAKYNGVFICGNNPHWIFLTSRGEFRMHPMYIDGPVQCFAQFHNVNCPQGFLYFNAKGELRICVLPIHLSYDALWPVRKVPLRCTPHAITYHLESKTYCIALSQQRYTNSYYKFNGEDKELATEEKDDNFPLPFQDHFSIVLFSPVSWEVIPNTKTDLEEWEHVTTLKTVSLAYEGTRSGLRGYVCVGTNFNYSEDITSRGRIIIYDIIDVVPEPGQPLTKNKMKVMYAKEQKGPVTAITNTQSGFLVTAVGQKIYIWQLKDNDLAGIAFIDTQIYAHRLLSAKSLILVADVYKSITLLRFQEEFRTLSLVGRGFRPTQVYAADFVVDNSQMGFIISDQEQNIVVYKYQPEARESLGGQRLLRKADFHLGQSINSFFRISCKKSTLSEERRIQWNSDKRHITMFSTLDGAIGYILPLPEKNYRRLHMLQNAMVSHVPHTAGLNPKAFRTYKSARKMLGNFARCTLDGELISMFVMLTNAERSEIIKKIGVKIEDILEDIYEMHMLTAHF